MIKRTTHAVCDHPGCGAICTVTVERTTMDLASWPVLDAGWAMAEQAGVLVVGCPKHAAPVEAFNVRLSQCRVSELAALRAWRAEHPEPDIGKLCKLWEMPRD